MNKELWMVWSKEGEYIAAIHGSYDKREGACHAIDRIQREHPLTKHNNALHPVRITVHLDD